MGIKRKEGQSLCKRLEGMGRGGGFKERAGCGGLYKSLLKCVGRGSESLSEKSVNLLACGPGGWGRGAIP
jgi:hypothetical protein